MSDRSFIGWGDYRLCNSLGKYAAEALEAYLQVRQPSRERNLLVEKGAQKRDSIKKAELPCMKVARLSSDAP